MENAPTHVYEGLHPLRARSRMASHRRRRRDGAVLLPHPCRVDLEPGAPIRYLAPDGSVIADGEVIEIDAPRRLVMTFAAHWDPELGGRGADSPSVARRRGRRSHSRAGRVPRPPCRLEAGRRLHAGPTAHRQRHEDTARDRHSHRGCLGRAHVYRVTSARSMMGTTVRYSTKGSPSMTRSERFTRKCSIDGPQRWMRAPSSWSCCSFS